jgi:hypothetical protein
MRFSMTLRAALPSFAVLLAAAVELPAQAINIDCGAYQTYIGADGTTWLADQYYTGGQQLYSSYGVSGTADSSLYRTSRVGYYGDFSYAIPVPNGTYNVTLKFAETQYWAAGQRVFNVSVNGAQVLSNFDVVAQGGNFTAIDKQFSTTATNGLIQISVHGVVNMGLLSAIQITPGAATSDPGTPAGPTAGTQTVNIDCGAFQNYTGADGTVWAKDQYYAGGTSFYTSYAVTNTADPTLYGTARIGYDGNFSYAIPVPNGSYSVTLKFAEVQYWAAGQRIFNVSLNGAQVLSNFDVVAQGGYFKAIDRQFPVTVANGLVQIGVTGVVNTGILSAIQIAGGGTSGGQPAPTPVLQTSPSSLTFGGAVGGANPVAQSVSITNAGGGTLNWTAGKSQPWLTLSSSAGTAPATLSIGVTSSGLAAGTYTDAVTIGAAGVSGSPQTIGITLNLTSAPAVLTLSTHNVSFSGVAGGSNPASQSVNISTGSGALNWTASKTQSWLSLPASSGTAPSALSLGVVTAGLSAGSYSDVVTISAPGAGVSAQTVGVTLTIAGNQSTSTQHYVSPGGSAGGDGSIENPWDLKTALSQPGSVKPGDTIWVRGGVYGDGRGVFYSSLLGTAAAPIIVKQYPGERATINGWLQVGCCDQNPHPSYGAYVWFWGLEFASSITDRTGQPDGPPSYGQSAVLDSIDTWAPGSKFINNIIHDTRLGPSMWKEAINAEAYGNVVYNNGFQASDRGHGHGFYLQNDSGTMSVSDNFSFNNFDNGLQAYGSSAAIVRNITVQGNIMFNNGIIAAGRPVADNVIFAWTGGLSGMQLLNNYFYDTPSRDLGYNELGWSSPNADIVAQNNYFMGGFESLAVSDWSSVNFQNNTVYSQDKFTVVLNTSSPTGGFAWDNNTYYGSGLFMYNGNSGTYANWPGWTHLDTHSVYRPGAPTGVWTFVRPNKYEPGRANIAVYNWDLASSVAVDVSAAIAPGTRYEVRDAQNFYGSAVATGTYNGTPIVIPMTGLTIAAPNGAVPNAPVHTAPQFGTFVLLPLP